MQRSSQDQQTLSKSLSLFQSGKFDKAEKLARSVLASEPRNAEILRFVALVCEARAKYSEAATLLAKAAAINPYSAEVHYNLGRISMRLGRDDQAVGSFQKCLALAPRNHDALHNLGIALHISGKLGEAEATMRQAIAIRPGAPLTHAMLGVVLSGQMRLAEAIESFKSALACGHPDPGYVWEKMGLAFMQLDAMDAAIGSFQKALEHSSKSLDLLMKLADCEMRVGQHLNAAQNYLRGTHLAPEDPGPLVGLAFARLQMAEWAEHASLVSRMGKTFERPSETARPFNVLSLIDDPANHLRCSKQYAARFIEAADRMHASRTVTSVDLSRDKIRVAYLSSDFRLHAVASLAVGLFEHHDHNRFETYAVAWACDESDLRRRIEAAFDHFIDVSGTADDAVAQLIRDHQIDIAIDLNGYTTGARPGILAQRPAPIQVNYLGYPGTMGAEWIDYLVADRYVVPPDAARFYSEELVYLPACYQANDSKRAALGVAPQRSALGLPEEAFVFVCFNATSKITPDMFAIWMRLLNQVPGSVLWLRDPGELAAANLRREAVAVGVDGQRLIFAPDLPVAEHMTRLQCADLFLDTLPYNAHTTASDALWAGVPIVTCPGQSFQARVAGSLLHAIGLPELIASSLADYESIALRLATNRDARAALDAKLASNRLTTPLFDTAGYTRALEAAYEMMWQRWCVGEKPARIELGVRRA